MSEWTYVLAAFSLTWTVLAGYAVFLNARVARAQAALDQAEVEG
jgi:CcmD family protein